VPAPKARAHDSPSQIAPIAGTLLDPIFPERAALTDRCSQSVGFVNSLSVVWVSESASRLKGVSPALTEATYPNRFSSELPYRRMPSSHHHGAPSAFVMKGLSA
jgi:hypothetical protein